MQKNIIKQIDDLHNNNDHESIIKLITSLSEKEQKQCELVHLLARAYNNISMYEKAIDLLLSIQEIEEDEPIWHYRIGYGYFYSGFEEKAIIHFNKAMELAPKTKKYAKLIADWKLVELIRECTQVIETKYLIDNFENERTNHEYILKYILYALMYHSIYNHKTDYIEDDIILEDGIYIPSWDLSITPYIIHLSDEYVEIKWNTNSSKLDNGITQTTTGAANNLKDALASAYYNFYTCVIQPVINTFVGSDDTILFQTEFLQHNHLWKANFSPVIWLDDENQNTQDIHLLWKIIETGIKNRLGNQSVIFISIAAVKIDNSVSCKCFINNVYSYEISSIITKYIEDNINIQSFNALKQSILITQDEATIIPYIYKDIEGYEELKANLTTLCQIIDEEVIEDEDTFNNVLDIMVNEIDDPTLAIEFIIFTPDICASRLYEHVDFPEQIIIGTLTSDLKSYYLHQFTDYSKIYNALWEIFDNMQNADMINRVYNKLMSLSITLSQFTDQDLADNSSRIILDPFEVILDEQFEIR